MELQKLTLHHYAEDPQEERRVTLSPDKVVAVAAKEEDTALSNGRSLREATILFSDGESMDLLINHSDLEKLESAIGSYCFE